MKTLEPDDYARLVARAGVPASAMTRMTPVEWTVRALHVDLRSVLDALVGRPDRPAVVQIYCDTLTVPNGFAAVIDDFALVVIARRIVVQGKAALNLADRVGVGPSVALFFDSMDGDLAVVCVTPDGPPEMHRPADIDTLGVVYSVADGRVSVTRDARIPRGQLRADSPLADALDVQFVTVTGLAAAEFPEAALASARFIAAVCTGQKAGRVLCLRAHAEAQRLLVEQGAASFVPPLTARVYRDLLPGYVQSAKLYEDQLTRLHDQRAAVRDRKRALEDSLASHAGALDYLEGQRDAADRDLLAAQATVYAAAAQVLAQRNRIEAARIAFEAGIAEFQRQQTLAAVFGVAKALFQVTVAVGAAVVVGPAAGAGASGSVGELAEVGRRLGAIEQAIAGGAGDGAAAVADTADDLANLADDFGGAAAAGLGAIAAVASPSTVDLTASISALFDALKMLMTIFGEAVALVQALTRLEAPTFDAPDATALDGLSAADISAAATIERFGLEALASLQPAIDAGVGGARQYGIELELLTFAIKTATAAQQTYVEAARRRVDLGLQVRLAEGETARLEKAIAEFEARAGLSDAMAVLTFRRHVEQKRGLILAVNQLRRAIRYEGLIEPAPPPAVGETVAVLDGLRDIELNRLETLAADPPQVLETQSLRFDDPALLDGLVRNGTAEFVVPPDAAELATLAAIRLDRVEVLLDGIAPTDAVVAMTIRTSGSYLDRRRSSNDAELAFVAAPFARAFQYRPRAAGPEIVLAGEIARGDDLALQAPGIFTRWRVELSPTTRARVDLTGLEAITLRFAGSARGRVG